MLFADTWRNRTNENRPSYSAFVSSAFAEATAGRSEPLSEPTSERPSERTSEPSCERASAMPIVNTSMAIPLSQADDTSIPPFRAEQADEEHQHDRHVPQLVLFHRRHAAAGVAKVVGKRRGAGGVVEASARFVGDASQRARVHGGIEVFGIAGRGAEMGDGAADALAGAGRLDLCFVPARRLGGDRRLI